MKRALYFMLFVPVLFLSGCVSSEFIEKSSTLAAHAAQFRESNERWPIRRKELEEFESEHQLESVTPWFSIVRFTENEKGEMKLYCSKGWLIWNQGSMTATYPKD